MEEMIFEIVKPVQRHARLIMDWRNDPTTLAMSFQSRPKRWETFYEEFLNTYFTMPELPCLFVWYGGKRVAFIRFQAIPHSTYPKRRCCIVSLNVAPDKRGQGIGSKVFAEIGPWVEKQGYDEIAADVKQENTNSKKALEKAGYGYRSTYDKYLEESDKVISVDRYLLQLTEIEAKQNVFVIAEAGSNWRVGNEKENLRTAFRLIDAAVEAKCDAVKFQTFRAKNLYVPNAGESGYLAKSGIKQDIFSLLSSCEMPYEMIPQLAKYCMDKNICFMSTPFSQQDFDVLNPYVFIHKIASYEISHPHLIRLAALSGKPTLISTGAAGQEDIEWALREYLRHGGKQLTLLQCTAEYPADPKNLNLRTIPFLEKTFGVNTGLSDHSSHPFHAPIAAVALGASVIEKHFTLDRSLPGPDHAFAISPGELKQMVIAVRETEIMLGRGVKSLLPEEQELYCFARRGIQAICGIQKGDVFHEGKNMAVLRPGNRRLGAHPKDLSRIEGRRATRPLALGEGIQPKDCDP